jgi:dihydroorotate dehydrogenase electron transfer subunit
LKICNSKILKNEQVIDNIYKLIIEFKIDKILPGQFFMLKTLNNEFLLPRPISVNDCDDNSVTFLYRIEGVGTKVISNLAVGTEIQALGPIGNGFDLDKIKGRVAIIGGGIGTAPLLYLAKKLKSKADIYLGFRDVTYGLDEFEKHSNKLLIATEDGSVGQKGFVTSLLNFEDYDCVVTCGPEVMMNAVMDACEKSNAKNSSRKITYFVSLEKRMACGVGACLGCVVETRSGMKRACKDGPVFNASELIR